MQELEREAYMEERARTEEEEMTLEEAFVRLTPSWPKPVPNRKPCWNRQKKMLPLNWLRPKRRPPLRLPVRQPPYWTRPPSLPLN